MFETTEIVIAGIDFVRRSSKTVTFVKLFIFMLGSDENFY